MAVFAAAVMVGTAAVMVGTAALVVRTAAVVVVGTAAVVPCLTFPEHRDSIRVCRVARFRPGVSQP